MINLFNFELMSDAHIVENKAIEQFSKLFIQTLQQHVSNLDEDSPVATTLRVVINELKNFTANYLRSKELTDMLK